MAHIDAVRQLRARYFRCIDTKNRAGHANILTDDAQFDVSDDAKVAAAYSATPFEELQEVVINAVGGEKIEAFIHGGIDGARTINHGHTGEIEITSHIEATGI